MLLVNINGFFGCTGTSWLKIWVLASAAPFSSIAAPATSIHLIPIFIFSFTLGFLGAILLRNIPSNFHFTFFSFGGLITFLFSFFGWLIIALIALFLRFLRSSLVLSPSLSLPLLSGLRLVSEGSLILRRHSELHLAGPARRAIYLYDFTIIYIYICPIKIRTHDWRLVSSAHVAR